MSKNTFGVDGTLTTMNGMPFLANGLRLSNSLKSDQTTEDLIAHLDLYRSYGINSFSVFLMGSRFGDIKGYLEDGSLCPDHARRLSRVIDEADARGMLVVVGCLYWSNSKAKWTNWTQTQANLAVANTVRFLSEKGCRNVLVDVDNEGMALREAGFDNRELVRAGKSVDTACVIATNFKGLPPPEADLGIHFAEKAIGKPYIETEGNPTNAPEGGYWSGYSKKEGVYGYQRVGVYTSEMKTNVCEIAQDHWANNRGFFFASTWLQAAPPQGPNHHPGGNGTEDNPGFQWWLDFLGKEYK